MSASSSIARSRGAIATPHHLATQAGQAALDTGGTAIDAAIAAATVLTVVYPHMSAIGGDVQALISLPGETPLAVNGSGAAARAISAESLRREFKQMPTFGVHPISVPGMVSAWQALHQRAGRLPWKSLFTVAIGLARDGVGVAPALARDISALTSRLIEDEGIRSTFFHADGKPLLEGERLVQPNLANTLQVISEQGAPALYGGDVGRRLVDGLRQRGSALTLEDFVNHETTFSPVLSLNFRGVDVLTAPPNTQGFVLLQILKALAAEGLNGEALGSDGATLARLFALTALDREERLADPRHVTVDTNSLLSDGYIESLRAVARDRSKQLQLLPLMSRPDGDTVAISAMDSSGHSISLIQSVFFAFGSGVLESDTGILCHNRGAAFSLDPRKPSYIVGGRRPPSTLTPCLLANDEGVFAAVGTMGGKSQPQILVQHLVRFLAGQSAQACLDQPRWVVGAFGADNAEVVLVESSVPSESREILAGAGLPLVVGEFHDDRAGHSQIVHRSKNGFVAATDPRGDGAI